MKLLSLLKSAAFIIISLNTNAIENEVFYSKQFCDNLLGQTEYLLKDLSRVDCLTDTHAFEVDWADGSKVYEAIGQSLYYSSETGRLPGILLLIRKENSEKSIRKVRRVIDTFELPIKLILLDVRI
tara:strand:- start:9 stop:386 length:378 start_codon:yes stop_codon:yes gene_type:complete